jgi:tetratricopeptide (TPR) repeat protein
MPTLCLNMIVKNESKIILRLLDSVVHFLDSYCICDTGSSDNTVELITDYFAKHGIKGKIVHEEFRDFGYNRTFSLNACVGLEKAEYILLLDADMKLVVNSAFDLKTTLTADGYYINQGNDQFNYKNIRIVKNNPKLSYWGVTHEYVNFPDNSTMGEYDRNQIYIDDIGDGGSKGNKTLRDIQLLTKGLEDIPNNDRYTFYLANSYRDHGDSEKAIEFYKKRVEIGGWKEEIWYSCYSIGKLYKDLNQIPEAIFYWLKAYTIFPNRIENLCCIVEYYRENSNFDLAHHFFSLADFERKKNPVWDYLFTEVEKYNFKLDYELSIIGYYVNKDNHDLKNVCMKIIKHPNIDNSMYSNVLSNYKFYCQSIIENAIPISQKNLDILQSIGKDLYLGDDMVSSTPSLCFGGNMNELIISVRFVNYRIDENGNYIQKENITTKNVIAVIDMKGINWELKENQLLKYDESYDKFYIGQEDIRLHRIDEDTILYNANRCNLKNEIKVEHGIIDINNFACSDSIILTKENENTIEKNWVLFQNKCIYNWFPLTIGDISSSGLLSITHTIHRLPAFFKDLRGSTNGVVIDNEVWFICHLVNYEDRRYYYHIVVVLDLKTYELKSYTPLWTFEKQKVEYTLGFVYLSSQKRLLIGYSIMDSITKYTMISKHIFDNMMISW